MIYPYQCTACGRSDDRFLRLAEYEKQRDKQKCEHCGGAMRRVIVAITLAGLDSGPDGFMRGRDENDGCCDTFTRRRVERNLGRKLGNGFFVPGLCKPGVAFDGEAVCYSRQEVIDKARRLGVGVRGPGINVEPAQKEPVKDDGVPSEVAIQHTLREEIKQNYGGKVTARKHKELTEMLRDRHTRRTPPRRTTTRRAIYE